MNPSWKHTFRSRMQGFEARRPPSPGEVAVSIKIRVTSGCFHREHSPHAYDIIDRHLLSIPQDQRDFGFEEHESGPEILVYLILTTAGISLAKSVIDLIVTILKARSKGIRQGDYPRHRLKLIIRRTSRKGEFQEEEVLQFESFELIDGIEIEKSLNRAAAKLLADERLEDG